MARRIEVPYPAERGAPEKYFSVLLVEMKRLRPRKNSSFGVRRVSALGFERLPLGFMTAAALPARAWLRTAALRPAGKVF